MDSTELDIAQLDEVSCIKYYTLPSGIMGLIVIYGRTGTLNLCAADKHYGLLEEAAARIYGEARGKNIAADSFTKELLERRSSTELPAHLAMFGEVNGSTEPLAVTEKTAVTSMGDMILYFLADIYRGFGKDIVPTGDITGYRHRYVIPCLTGGEERIIPFEVWEKTDGYVFRFGNISEPQHSAELTVRYAHSAMTAVSDCICGRTIRREYIFDMGNMTLQTRLSEMGEIFSCGTEKLSAGAEDASERPFAACGVSRDKRACAVLPWGGRFYISEGEGYSETVFEESRLLRHSRREFAAAGNIPADSSLGVHVFLDRAISSHFLPTGYFSRGIYRERFENRYFLRDIPHGGEER